MTSALTHFDAAGQAHMVDVGGKDLTRRVAVARGEIHMRPETLALIRDGHSRKGDVIGIARIAAIQGAKRTADLIPLCHPISLTRVAVDFRLDPDAHRVICEARTECTGQTGVEMEALTAVSVAALTVYDMAKALDRGMQIGGIELVSKSGGKSGEYRRTA